MYDTLSNIKADAWSAVLPKQLEHAFDASKHGDLSTWFHNLEALPHVAKVHKQLDSSAITLGNASDLSAVEQQQLELHLRNLHPWRKGPYDLFGIKIDTEWRSDWKWDRVKNHITPLQHRSVLDIGCGNGYHCWRMLGAGAKAVIGVDPMLLNVMQFLAVKKLLGDAAPIHVLPLGIEHIPNNLKAFDTVFSMGVLYHRRSPIDHLMELRDTLQPGGELVLETLVIEGKLGEVLLPEDRYAKMRNVWFLPSCATLESWLKRCGFKNIRLIDVTVTTEEEQRSTDWMRFHSLKDFLDPCNAALTCEGLPAPKRAIFIAQTA